MQNGPRGKCNFFLLVGHLRGRLKNVYDHSPSSVVALPCAEGSGKERWKSPTSQGKVINNTQRLLKHHMSQIWSLIAHPSQLYFSPSTCGESFIIKGTCVFPLAGRRAHGVARTVTRFYFFWLWSCRLFLGMGFNEPDLFGRVWFDFYRGSHPKILSPWNGKINIMLGKIFVEIFEGQNPLFWEFFSPSYKIENLSIHTKFNTQIKIITFKFFKCKKSLVRTEHTLSQSLIF